MNNPLFAIRDDVASTFHPPFVDSTPESAKRSFFDAVRSGKIPHAEDYVLYRIGTYSTDNGMIVPLGVPELVARGSDMES